MHITRRAFAPAIILISLSTTACGVQINGQGAGLSIGGSRAADTWSRTYALPAGGRLEIVNTNGRIDVEQTEGSRVEVRVERTARASTESAARRMLDTTRMAEEVSADRVRIEAMPPDRGLSRLFVGFDRGLSLEYTVRVPAGLNLAIETRNGGIRLTNVSGTIFASTRNGGITGQRLSGSVTAQARNGGIRLDMAALTGDLDLSLRNGGIRLDLPRDARAALDARAQNGGISIDDDLGFETTERSREHERFREDRRRLAGTLNGGGQRITATTRNGGIRNPPDVRTDLLKRPSTLVYP